MSKNGDMNRRARDRMHVVLRPEFFLMWLVSTWVEQQPYYRSAMEDLRRALRWAVRRYLDGKLEP